MRTSVSCGDGLPALSAALSAASSRSKRARAHAQDQLVHIGDEIVDRAIGAADLAGQIAGFQAGQSPVGDHPLRRQDQVCPQFRSSFQWL